MVHKHGRLIARRRKKACILIGSETSRGVKNVHAGSTRSPPLSLSPFLARRECARGVSEIFPSDLRSQETSFDDGRILSRASEPCPSGIREKEELSPLRRARARARLWRRALFCSNNCVQNQFAVTKWSRAAGRDLESAGWWFVKAET